MLSDKELSEINVKIKKVKLDKKIAKIKEDILMIPLHNNVTDKLLIFQIHHVQNLVYSIINNGMAVDMSDTGTGKTYAAGAICRQLNLRPLVIGPKSVISNWYKICNEFDVLPLGVVNYETIKNNKYYADLSDFESEAREICPYIEIIRVNKKNSMGSTIYTKSGQPVQVIQKIIWKLPKNTLIIFDEAHKGKNGLLNSNPSANSQLMVSVKNYIDKEEKKYGLFLSATITDKCENLDVILYLFGFYKPYISKSYKNFINSLGNDRLKVFKKLHALIFPYRGSRISISDLPPGIFKKNIITAKTYTVSDDIAKDIEDHHKIIRNAMQSLREKGESQGFGFIIRCWQKIEVLKSPIIIGEIINYLSENKSVVIFINFNETKRLITNKLLENKISIDVIDYIHGDQTGDERSKIIDSFQNDELHVLICNIKAGGVGVSLHDINGNRQRVTLIFPTWSSIDLKQALGRIYRANAKSDAIQNIVYCKPLSSTLPGEAYLTIEEKICMNVNTKLENIELLNNNDLVNIIKI